MHIITERQHILSVFKRWQDQYKDLYSLYPDKKIITEKLRSLDLSSATSKEIADIIGNDAWTKTMCSECGNYTSDVIMIGQSPDSYDSETVYVCVSCIKQAWNLAEKELIKKDG